MNITVAGVGYVGLAQAVLLAQHNAVTAVTTTPAKAEQINRGVSPIVDAEITDFLRTKPLTLTATVDAERAYRTADVVVIATPTDYEDDVAEACRGLSRKAYDVASLLADGAAGDGDWELFDLADEARSAAVALLRALDGDA